MWRISLMVRQVSMVPSLPAFIRLPSSAVISVACCLPTCERHPFHRPLLCNMITACDVGLPSRP